MTNRVLKPLVFAASSVPLALLAFDFARGALADPIAQAMNRLGFWTLTFVCIALACTPAKLLVGWTWPNRVRRMLGLFAFTYAALHFTCYLVLDQFFDWQAIWEDVAKRKFITVGFAAFLMLIPLALTSTNRWVKRLGFPRWKALHRLIYVIAAAGVVHYAWRVKIDYRDPIVFAAVVALLLSVRLWAWLSARLSAPRASPSQTPEGP